MLNKNNNLYHQKYPPNVLNILEDCILLFKKLGVESAILFGSTAKGEFSYFKYNENYFCLSDLEFLLVSRNKPSKNLIRQLRTDIDLLKQKYKDLYASPFFHIDFSWISERRFQSLPGNIRHYELIKKGLILFQNYDLMAKAPKIDITNINLSEVRDLIIERLWQLLLYLPSKPNATRLTKISAVYCLNRNFVELSTILLPFEQVLLPTYQERVAFIKSNYDKLGFKTFMSDGFVDRLQFSLEGKINSKEEIIGDLVEYYVNLLKDFQNAWLYIHNKIGEMNKDFGDIIRRFWISKNLIIREVKLIGQAPGHILSREKIYKHLIKQHDKNIKKYLKYKKFVDCSDIEHTFKIIGYFWSRPNQILKYRAIKEWWNHE